MLVGLERSYRTVTRRTSMPDERNLFGRSDQCFSMSRKAFNRLGTVRALRGVRRCAVVLASLSFPPFLL